MWCVRCVIGLRYKITFSGMELFDDKRPVIVFPNHPALVDPMILVSYIAKKKILSPVMTETYFHTPGLGPVVRALRTVPVWDLSKWGTIEDVERAFEGIDKAIKNKQNILVYPSGHIYVQPFEHIVGKKMAYEIVSRMPEDARVIVARTRWLWGSMWGKAYTGDSPQLVKVLFLSLWHIVANLVFFSPRRDVSIEFFDMTDELRGWQKLWLDSFNKKLEEFYNASGDEACRFIPHYFYYDDVAWKEEPKMIVWSVAELEKTNNLNIEIPDDILYTVWEKISQIKKIDIATIHSGTNLVLDLYADSLDMAEIKSTLQSHFPHASNPPIWLLKTVSDLCLMVMGKLEGEDSLPPSHFVVPEKIAIDFSYQEGDTILSRAKNNFRTNKSAPFVYDTIVGEMTRDTFLLRSYVISTYLHRYKNSKIGIMMPALSSTSLLLFGIYLSGKTPVMLNWTVWEKSFAHCMSFAGLETILTSRKFYEKIQSPWLTLFESKMIFVEDIVKDISLWTKLIALLRKSLFLLPKQTEEAVILFTSGSESLPKAVSLTHKNILSNIEWALNLVPFSTYETIIWFLPPFHSFGFTINTIFPLVAPVQAAYTPDPGDVRTIGKIVSHTQASIVSATPTFLRMILSWSEKDTLQSLRFAFVWAEKCSDEVFSLFEERCPKATILEGYGITECSPIVTVNPMNTQKKGSAGKFLPTLEYRIRSLDNSRDLSHTEQGMIYVSGPSIFSWYLDPSLESPFMEIDGKNWYKTGDLGYVDTEGFLFITGRLKRFVKIAGEMISLPFIEGILLEKYGNPETTTMAIEAKEENGNVTIVAFTTFEVTIDELNEYIRSHGASNLVKIARVEQIESIPVLGTGKTDYKSLKSMI